MQANDFLRLLHLLSGARVDFVVGGGTAAVLHGATTATYALDVLMQFTPQNCERLLHAVSGISPRLSHTADKRPLQLTAAELSKVRNLYLLTDLGRLDVLGSLPPLDEIDEVFRQSEQVELEGLKVRVLSLGQLIAVKSAMSRPKDKLMEAELRAIANVRDAAKNDGS